MKTAVVSIGTELLIGQVTNTNVVWLGEQLNAIGITIEEQITLADEAVQITQTLHRLAETYDLILMTGGLGPTKDDITKSILAQLLDCDLVTFTPQADLLRHFFHQRGKEIGPQVLNQALIPAASEGFINTSGAVPLIKATIKQAQLYALPGVPSEMKSLMQTYVLPQIQTHFQTDYIENRIFMFSGITESNLSVLLDEVEKQTPLGVSLAYLPNFQSIRLRASLKCTIKEKTQLIPQFNHFCNEILRVGDRFCYATQDTNLETVIGEWLHKHQQTVSFAESCSGGMLCGRMVTVPGASNYISGGIIAYTNEVKKRELGVTQAILDEWGAVSEPCVQAMAEGVKKAFHTHYGLALSGIVGPAGERPGKPVGTVCWAIATENYTHVGTFHLNDLGRIANIERAIVSILDKFRRVILKIEV